MLWCTGVHESFSYCPCNSIGTGILKSFSYCPYNSIGTGIESFSYCYKSIGTRIESFSYCLGRRGPHGTQPQNLCPYTLWPGTHYTCSEAQAQAVFHADSSIAWPRHVTGESLQSQFSGCSRIGTIYCSGRRLSDADRAAIVARVAMLKQKLAAAKANLVSIACM